MNPRTSPTIRQLAEWGGVSISTISRALRNHPSIPPRTRQRLQTLAKEKGYRFDPVVATLMATLRTKRSLRTPDRLGFVISWPRKSARASEHLRDCYAGACKRAEELGYTVEEIWSRDPGMTSARLSRILYTRSIRGLILAPLLPSIGHASLKWDHFSVVAIGHTLAKPDLHRVVHDHFAGMQTTLRRLRHLEYRRIGFAAPFDQNMRSGARWLASYLLFQSTLPASSRIPHFLPHDFSREKLGLWIERHKLDAVVGNTVDVLTAIRALGYSVPKDLGFAAVDLIRDVYQTGGIDQRDYTHGYAAADMLIKNLQQNEFGLPAEYKTVYIKGAWKDGTTLRKRRA